MKGYKGMNMDMTCRGMQYEVGKSYHIDNPVMCKQGFHFCKNLEETFDYYRCECSRFFEIEASGEIKCDDSSGKMVASDLTILREIDKSIINRFVYTNEDIYSSSRSCGDGRSYGDSHGNGMGYGGMYGNGNIYGNGYGDGHSNGNGCGLGCGHIYNNGNGYGCGDCGASGDGHGDARFYINGAIILKILEFK